MNLGILTMVGLNIGNRLQNYALQTVLEKLGHKVYTINGKDGRLANAPFSMAHCFSKYYLKLFVKLVLNRSGIRNDFAVENRRKKLYASFEKRIKYTGIDEPDGKAIDCFVVGSDQVWNPDFIQVRGKINNSWFADFGKPRISYAASFGVSSIAEQYQKQYTEQLNAFKAISVREQAGVEIVKQLTGRDAELSVDPTLLLSKEEWEQIEEKPAWYDEDNKYLLTYFLGERSEELNKVMEEIAKEKGLEFIHVLDKSNLDWYCVNPSQFVYLVHHAELIYTDSFHASVFSIIFQKPFVVCDRVQVAFRGKKNMNSRIDTLLGYFGLEDRRGNEENEWGRCNLSNYSFEKVNEVLFLKQSNAVQYLKESLRI